MFKAFIIRVLKFFKVIDVVPGLPSGIVPNDENIPSHPSPGFKQKVKLGIIVGHTKTSPGATFFNKTNEYVYNSEIARLMVEICKTKVLPIDPSIIFRDGIGIAGAYAKAFAQGCDAVIELHCNAYNAKARGTLTYVSSNTEDVEFAHEIQKAMVSVFGTDGRPVTKEKGRGVQVISRSDRGGSNVYAYPGMPNCLTEPAFCDEQQDCKLLMDKKWEYANGLLNAVVLWATKKDIL